MSKLLGIENWLNQYVENLSSGIKLKLVLARTLLLERVILFLDEPTIGLDVKTVNLFIDKIKNVETTVIFTSYNLSVVEKLCDRIVFINEGKTLKIGTQEEDKDLLGPGINVEIILEKGSQELISELKGHDFISEKIEGKNRILVHLLERKHYRNLLKILTDYEISKIKEVETSLEDLFLKLVN